MSKDTKITNIVRPNGHFLRSVQLERDFRDPKALESFIITPTVMEHLKRIADGLRPESGDRAFRILGSYGSGKSTFALLLAHWLRGDSKKLPERLRSAVDYNRFRLAKAPRLYPLLVTGRREPLPEVIRRAIADDLARRPPRRGPKVRLDSLLQQETLSGADSLEMVRCYKSRIIEEEKCRGVVLIIDELGKVLEYTAQNPDESDVFLLQMLAEDAARRSDDQFVIIGILHAGFSSYAHALGMTQTREWEKVAGRYSQLPFKNALDQSVRMLTAALNVDLARLSRGEKKSLTDRMENACRLGWYGAAADGKQLSKEAPSLFPLDPYVLPVLDRFLHIYGQNERSVFSFLFGNEPHGMMDHLERNKGVYYLEHLYAYVHENFDHVLSDRPEANTWIMIKSLLAAAETGENVNDAILRVVAILNLLGASDLLPTAQLLTEAVDTTDSSTVKECIRALQSAEGKRVLFDRGGAGGFCLWPHVSVDLHAAYEIAAQHVGTGVDALEFIRDHVENQNIIARKHYISTGNLRHFHVCYCTLDELEKLMGKTPANESADGVLLIPLLRHKSELKKARMLALGFNAEHKCIVAVPSRAVDSLADMIREASIWEHIRTETPALNSDPYARDTVSVRCERESTRLSEAIQGIVGLGRFFGKSEIELFWKGMKQEQVASGRQFAAFLSTVFDAIYDEAPHIRHELLNRDNLSSAAAGARMRLIEGLLDHPQEYAFGIPAEKRPPEMSMYLSVFENGNLHQRVSASDEYTLKLPSPKDDEALNIRPVLQHLHEWLRERSDVRIPIPEVFDHLRGQPYGVKRGLAPLLLVIEAMLHDNEVAFYEDERFVSRLTGAEIQRLLKDPFAFEVQYCKIKGVRAEAFKQIAETLEINLTATKLDLLDVVRPLCTFAARLPPYVLKTRRLSDVAIAVRDTLMETRDPIKLLFTELPRACGVPAIDPNAHSDASVGPLVTGLGQSIEELRQCYYELRGRILDSIIMHFNGTGPKRRREDAMERATILFKTVADPKLKAFCFRLCDNNLPDPEWGESVASLIVSKPPSKWVDGDEGRFEYDLGELIGRFHRAEAAGFASGSKVDPNAVRVCLTLANGEERAKVTASSRVSTSRLNKLRTDLENLIANEGETGLVALSEVLWKALEK